MSVRRRNHELACFIDTKSYDKSGQGHILHDTYYGSIQPRIKKFTEPCLLSLQVLSMGVETPLAFSILAMNRRSLMYLVCVSNKEPLA